MIHRPLDAIDRDIAATEAALRRLHGERRASVKAKNAAIVADFDAGMAIVDVAAANGLSRSVTQSILFRAGRTQGCRIAIKAAIRALHQPAEASA
jgi:hypothetical protein